MGRCTSIFLENGYSRIGMDHFAKPTDELAEAQLNKKVYRNIMGYSPGKFEDTIAIGTFRYDKIS